MIREATIDDLTAMLVLGQKFVDELPETHAAEMDKISSMIQHCINDDNAVAIIAVEDDLVVGALLGIVAETWLSYEVSATEVCWFVDKNYRGKDASKVMKAFEDWAESKDADYITVADIQGIANLESLYTRNGYSKVETSYSKRV